MERGRSRQSRSVEGRLIKLAWNYTVVECPALTLRSQRNSNKSALHPRTGLAKRISKEEVKHVSVAAIKNVTTQLTVHLNRYSQFRVSHTPLMRNMQF